MLKGQASREDACPAYLWLWKADKCMRMCMDRSSWTDGAEM